MGHDGVRFATIDLERHADVCVAFRRDSFIVSFGDDQRFMAENGADGSGYLDWLEQRIATYPPVRSTCGKATRSSGRSSSSSCPTAPAT